MDGESYKLCSFKEFIAKSIAEDFHSPTIEDWDNAEVIMDGNKNFIYGQVEVDKENYCDLVFLHEYELFMLDPQTWIEACEQDRGTDTIGLLEELLNTNQNIK